MIILGNRILVSKVEEEKKEGFQTVEVQDSFLYKGKVEQIGNESQYYIAESSTHAARPLLTEGDVVLFAKYSPHTQTVEVEGQDMKIIRIEDVLAVL